MKIIKSKDNFIRALKSVTDREFNIVDTFITIDLDGNMIIEGTNSYINYSGEKISLNSQDKTIYIYGEKLKVLSCSKSGLHITGDIKRIELFEVK